MRKQGSKIYYFIMVPQFEDFLYPFLYSLKNGALSISEVTDKIIKHFNLTEEDCMLKTKGGNKTQIADRINWCRQYFRRALFIEIPKRGTYQITTRGSEYLKNNDSLAFSDLMKYEEFAEYAGASHKVKDNPNEVIIPIEVTPTEALEDAYNTINSTLMAELLDLVLSQTPKFFEQLVVDLLKAMGYGGSDMDAAMVTQYTKDDGIDGIIKEDKLGLDKIYIQAKRWNTVVSKPEVQKFIGALDEQKANKGVFITTSSFSKEAKELPNKASKKIVLIDGEQLAKYMIEYNVGVSVKKAYIIKKIDTDYFIDEQ